MAVLAVLLVPLMAMTAERNRAKGVRIWYVLYGYRICQECQGSFHGKHHTRGRQITQYFGQRTVAVISTKCRPRSAINLGSGATRSRLDVYGKDIVRNHVKEPCFPVSSAYSTVCSVW